MNAEKGQDFIAQVAQLSEGVAYAAAGSGTFDPGELATRVLPNLWGGQLFAYLFRRFGYPSYGWDSYKDLVIYYITTPRKDVFLTITPRMSGDARLGGESSYDATELMFGYCIDQAIDQAYIRCLSKEGYDSWPTHELYQQCMLAFEAALRDLTRPVFIRDIPINCYGRVHEKDSKNLPEVVEPSHMAGYPIPDVLFKSIKRYRQFWDAIQILGNGRFEQGIEAILQSAAEKQRAREDEFNQIVAALEEGEEP